MSSVLLIIHLLLRLYVFAVIIRILVESIQSFARQWRPQPWFMRACEPIFIITDPPIKLLRRVIPPLRLGAVSLDMSVIVLFIILQMLLFLTLLR